MTIDVKVKEFLEGKDKIVENTVMRLGRFMTQGQTLVSPVMHRTTLTLTISDQGYLSSTQHFSLKKWFFGVCEFPIVGVYYRLGYWLDGVIDFEEGDIAYPSKYHPRVEEYFKKYRDVIAPAELVPSLVRGFHAGEIRFDTSTEGLPIIL
ncbi:hypothetical protein HYX04_04850 [Candidatus Woesearchaeota archaeon]|nr:hypothetical protein [Candidatus Woesearchaeota archaeon]